MTNKKGTDHMGHTLKDSKKAVWNFHTAFLVCRTPQQAGHFGAQCRLLGEPKTLS